MLNCPIIVFAKAPAPGSAKTRLIPALGEEGAAALQRLFVHHTLYTALLAGLGAVELHCWPSDDHPFFQDCAARFGVKLRRQQGGDLGERMENAFREMLERTPYCLIIGTDCPSLSVRDYKGAAQELGRGIDAVFVPVEDGGYGLLGLRRVDAALFRGISWGSRTVMAETRERLWTLTWRWKEMPVRWDVDRPEDLSRLNDTILPGYRSFRKEGPS